MGTAIYGWTVLILFALCLYFYSMARFRKRQADYYRQQADGNFSAYLKLLDAVETLKR